MTERTSTPGPAVRSHQESGRGTVRVPYPVHIRTTRLVSSERVTPHMLRLKLVGPEVADLHTYACDDHVGVVFPREDGRRDDPVHNPERLMLDWPTPSPPMRKYTIRRHDPASGELELDVVLHPGGLASDWAVAARPGDEVVLAGPPGSLAFAHTYAHYIFALDTTALPALARWLEEGDWIEERGVTVDVLVDHDHAEETSYPLPERVGVEVRWLDRTGGSRLPGEVAKLHVTVPEDTFLFAAGEASDLRPVRSWAKEHQVAALVTGYWKRNATRVDHEDEGVADGEEHHSHDHDEEHEHA